MGDGEVGSSAEVGEDQQSGDSPKDDPRRGARGGFLSRILGALTPSEVQEADGPAPVNGAAGVATQLPGMANLRRLSVEDVMMPKADIVSVPSDIGKDELVAVFRDSGVSRIPVYKGTLDTPVGLIHLKDFALRYGFNGRSSRFSLTPMLRPLIYAPPSMPLGALLQKMQAERVHMALVIDEYGGVDGLVTIEDIIEQVVGEIEDEHDTDEAASFQNEAPNTWIARATTSLAEFEAAVGRKLAEPADEEEIDTLGGLVVKLAGHVPARGEVVPHPEGHEFVVVDADPRRVKRVRVRLKEPEDATG